MAPEVGARQGPLELTSLTYLDLRDAFRHADADVGKKLLTSVIDRIKTAVLTCFSSNVAFRGFDQSTPGGSGRWLWI